jgi:glutamate dehydrogenase
VRAVFQTYELWNRVITANLAVATTLSLLQYIQDFVESMAAWFLRHRGPALRPEAEVKRFGGAIAELREELPAILARYPVEATTRQRKELTDHRLPDSLATALLTLGVLSRGLDAADTAAQVHLPIRDVATAMLELDVELDLAFLSEGIGQTSGVSHWESMARSAVQDEVVTVRRQVLAAALHANAALPPDHRIHQWLTENQLAVTRFQSIADQMRAHPNLDLAMACTALAELRLLLQSVTASPLAMSTS